jgi:DNA-binding transcriptional ArsR family regulator
MTYEYALTALADPTRRKVFECSPPISRPAVSQHLKALKAAGLVQERSEGTRRIYSARREGLVELRDWLDSFWGDALDAFKAEAEKTEGESE